MAHSTEMVTTSRALAWTVWLVASIFYAYQYVLRVMPNIMMDNILQQFHIDAATFGQFSGVYYIGYSLMHIPVGILLDRYGPRKVLPICMWMTVVGLAPILWADYWVYPILGRLLIGMGSSAAILGTFKVIRITFPEARFTRMLSLSVTIGLLGAIYGGGPVDYLCTVLGYQKVVAIFAVLGLILSGITYVLVPNIPAAPHQNVFQDIKVVLTNRKVMGICILAGLMTGPLEGFADVWGSNFLKHVYGLDNTIAASLPSVIFMGMCFGAPILSFVAEKTHSHLGTIISAGAVMALCFFALLGGHVPMPAIGPVFIIVGVCCAYQILAIYKASTYVSPNVVGLTTAVANMIIMIFGYFFHSIIGYTVNATGGPTNIQAITDGILVIPMALTIATIGFLYMLRKSA